MTDRERPGERTGTGPRTALGEVLAEAQDAGRRTTGSERRRRRDGEAGDAVTPNTDAQEQSSGED